jgi:hypothetical protein
MCDGTVTGCDGKCYGLNICKLLAINMCDGVTAWGGGKASKASFKFSVFSWRPSKDR